MFYPTEVELYDEKRVLRREVNLILYADLCQSLLLLSLLNCHQSNWIKNTNLGREIYRCSRNQKASWKYRQWGGPIEYWRQGEEREVYLNVCLFLHILAPFLCFLPSISAIAVSLLPASRVVVVSDLRWPWFFPVSIQLWDSFWFSVIANYSLPHIPCLFLYK